MTAEPAWTRAEPSGRGKEKGYGSMTINEAKSLVTNHGIIVQEIEPVTGSFKKDIFLINNAYVLRPSLASMQKEQDNFRRIERLCNVPKIEFQGTYESDEDYFYTILNMLPGKDFIDAIAGMTAKQQRQLGVSVALFLNALHGITGSRYDIGHYIPLIPDYSGTWKNGHILYWDYLQEQTENLKLTANAANTVKQAIRYLYSHADDLEYQSGPVLLHNDFHPKNIVVHNGDFSGVIDWECSQYGESDFELCHLIHWCLFPPKTNVDFRPFLSSLFGASPKCASVPNISGRLTIYQIEHELIQLIWSGGASETDRTHKLAKWLEGSVDDLLKSF